MLSPAAGYVLQQGKMHHQKSRFQLVDKMGKRGRTGVLPLFLFHLIAFKAVRISAGTLNFLYESKTSPPYIIVK